MNNREGDGARTRYPIAANPDSSPAMQPNENGIQYCRCGCTKQFHCLMNTGPCKACKCQGFVLKDGLEPGIMSVFSPPAPAMQEESIETLLEPLVLAAIRLNRLANSSIDMDEIDKATEVYAAARTALLAHYQELERELDEGIDRYCGICVSCRSLAVMFGVCRACGFKQRESPDLIDRLRSEISSLKASQITAEEAGWLLQLESAAMYLPSEVLGEKLFAKLRLSASQATP